MAELPLVRAMQGLAADEEEYILRNESKPEGVHVKAVAHPLLGDGNDRVVGAVGTFRDVTTEKKVEAELQEALREARKNEDVLQTVIASMADGVVVADVEGNFMLFNAAAENIVGVGMVDAPPEEWTDQYGLFHPDRKTHIATEDLPLVRAMNGKRTTDMEIFVRNEKRPDGVYIVVNGTPMTREAGGHIGGVAVFHDVTEKRRVEEERSRALKELREQTELMDVVFDNISEGIVAVDVEGRLIRISRAALSITGLDSAGGGREQMGPASGDMWTRGMGFDVYREDGTTPVMDEDLPILRAAIRGEVIEHEDLVFVSPAIPEGITLQASARPLIDPNGLRRGGVAVFRDVTEARRAEVALAEAFAEGRTEIIDTVLHNVGNAVNSVETGIETIERALRDDRLVERFSMLAEAIESNRGRWPEYVGSDPKGRNVLPLVIALAKDFAARDARIVKAVARAKSRSGHIAEIIRTQRVFKDQTGGKKKIRLGRALEKCVGLVEHLLAADGIECEVDCRFAPSHIVTHESHFQQAMVNVLKNGVDAIRARSGVGEPNWSHRIRIRAYGRRTRLAIEVEDSGIGIPQSALRTIFTAGYSTKRDGDGTRAALGGRVRKELGGEDVGDQRRRRKGCDDTLGDGAAAGLRPGSARRAERWAGPVTGDANRRILIVDDQPEIHDDFAEILMPGVGERASDELARALAGRGERAAREDEGVLPDFELSHAYSGGEACEEIEGAWEAGRPYALAFVDVRMPPGMDGIETIQRLRQTDRDIEIVVMTAYSDWSLGEMVQRMEPLHKILYIRKPFSSEEIQQMAMCLVGKWNVERALAEGTREIAASKRTLEAVLDATDDAMVMFDPAGRVVFGNRGFEKLCGLEGGNLVGMRSGVVAEKLEERFREPEASDVEAGFMVGGDSSLVEEVNPEKDALALFYRSSAVVKDVAGTALGSLEVYRNVSKDIEVQRMKAEVMRLRGELKKTHSFGDMVGGSRRMREVYGLIRQAAATDVTVLVRGETGTGKELVAKAFHENGERRDGPFVAINCAAIPGELVESELFGHEKGAFTGATARRRGAFERASGGTLFLDEIGDMRPDLQIKLVRVLQEREFNRVGGGETIVADVRVIAATNRDLETSVKEGTFRQDLFYRLSVFPVTMPALRERREDIPLLAGHFLSREAAREGKSIDGLSTAAVRLLIQYDWPGNVRELANAIQRAVVLETADVLQAESLPRRLATAGDGGSDVEAGEGGIRTLASIEREALASALEHTGNNVAAAARGLGIDRSTLYRKLKRHGLRRTR